MQTYREGHLNIVICAVGVSWQSLGVCKTLLPDVVHMKHIRMIAALYVSSADLLLAHKFTILDAYTKELKKAQNLQNWWVNNFYNCTNT